MILGYKHLKNLTPWLKDKGLDDFADLEKEHAELCEWLRVATDGLAAPAKERIQPEIGAHYAQAVAAHVADGLSESDAKAAAVAELGDAKAAARRLRESHLTEGQGAAIESELKNARAVWFLLLCYFWFLLGCVDFFTSHDVGHNQFPVMVFGLRIILLVIIPTASHVVARRGRATPGILLLSWLSRCGFSIAIVCRGLLLDRAHPFPVWDEAVFAVVMLIVFGGFLYWLRILRKIRSLGDGWQEMPPPNAAS